MYFADNDNVKRTGYFLEAENIAFCDNLFDSSWFVWQFIMNELTQDNICEMFKFILKNIFQLDKFIGHYVNFIVLIIVHQSD